MSLSVDHQFREADAQVGDDAAADVATGHAAARATRDERDFRRSGLTNERDDVVDSLGDCDGRGDDAIHACALGIRRADTRIGD